jgi:hypothetical protein
MTATIHVLSWWRRALLRLAAGPKKPPAPSLKRSAARKALAIGIAETTNSARGALTRE